MTGFVALLRAVNVGGRSVPMAELRELAAALELDEPKTLLQSGNLVFTAGKTAGATLGTQLESAIQKRFGIAVDVILRDGASLSRTIRANPFPELVETPTHLVVVFLKDKPSAKTEAALAAAIRGPETIRLIGSELFAHYPDGQGRSKLALPLIEKHLGTVGTARNWNTVEKLAALTAERA